MRSLPDFFFLGHRQPIFGAAQPLFNRAIVAFVPVDESPHEQARLALAPRLDARPGVALRCRCCQLPQCPQGAGARFICRRLKHLNRVIIRQGSDRFVLDVFGVVNAGAAWSAGVAQKSSILPARKRPCSSTPCRPAQRTRPRREGPARARASRTGQQAARRDAGPDPVPRMPPG